VLVAKTCYQFSDQPSVAVAISGLPQSYARQWKIFEAPSYTKVPLEITFCKDLSRMPKTATRCLSGNYKSLPWKLTVSENPQGEPGQIFFYAPCFVSFLGLRIALLPYLKRRIAAAGGFSMLGAAFRYGRKNVILCGVPGAGKTRLLLEAVARGAEFLGDNELAVSGAEKIWGLFRDIELRFATARDTIFWQKLRRRQQWQLRFYRWISSVSRHKISFNVLIHPREFGIEEGTGWQDGKAVFVYLGGDCPKMNIPAETIIQGLADYERGYRKMFGDLIYAESFFQMAARNMAAFANRSVCWQLPSKSTVDEIFEMISHD